MKPNATIKSLDGRNTYIMFILNDSLEFSVEGSSRENGSKENETINETIKVIEVTVHKHNRLHTSMAYHSSVASILNIWARFEDVKTFKTNDVTLNNMFSQFVENYKVKKN